MGALAYLELTFVKNQLRAILRSPGRLAIWLFYLVILALAAASRLGGGHHVTPRDISTLSTSALHTAFGGAFLAMIGGAAVYHALGTVVAFRSRAEALLVNNAGLSSEAVVRFLQLRKLIAPLTRWLWTIVLNFVVLLPPRASRAELLRVFVASICVAAILSTIEIPAFLLGKRGFRYAIATAGSLAGALGAFFVFGGLLRLVHVDVIPPWLLPFDPGSFVASVVRGDWTALAALGGTVAFFVVLAFALGSDTIPELYSASLRTFDKFERARSTTLGAQFSAGRAHARPRIPAGSYALIWKSWIAFRRQRGAVVWFLTMIGGAIAIGASLAFIANVRGETEGAWQTLTTLITMAALVPVFVAVTVADDLAKPLWWMTASSLFNRLNALTFGRAWRGGVVVGTAPFVLALLTRQWRTAAVVYPVSLALWWALNAGALAIYAAFPSRFDFRGPLFIFRVFATIAVTFPMLLAFGLTVDRTASVSLALCAAAAASLLVGLPSLAFAAWRLRNRGIATSLLERAS